MFSPEALKEANQLLERYPIKMNALMPMLHLAQNANEGYLTSDWLKAVADLCEVSPTHVEGVATFYTMFKFKKPGKYHLQICTNISCGLCGGDEILEDIEGKLGIHAGETTEDGKFSIEEVECLGACGYGPAAIVNTDYHERLTVESFNKVVDELAKK